MSKNISKKVTLVPVPIDYQGLQCWCALDSEDSKLLSDSKMIQARIDIKLRSLPQNALWAVWYGIISTWTQGEYTSDQIKVFCKLHFGAKLLASQDETFRNFYNKNIRSLSYEQKLEFISLVQVTSKLSKDNGMKYQSAIQQYYSEKGLALEVFR